MSKTELKKKVYNVTNCINWCIRKKTVVAANKYAQNVQNCIKISYIETIKNWAKTNWVVTINTGVKSANIWEETTE